MNRTIRLTLNLLLLSVGAPILVLIAFQPVWAANHYIRASATGTGDGSNWTNACTDFTGSCAVSSLVRGDTYYVGTGTYARLTLNTAVSGTLLITIKGATAANHGTDTGWLSAFGVDVTQAQFTYGGGSGGFAIGINTNYWVVDGSVGSGNTSSSYGFLLNHPTDCTTPTQVLVQVPGVGGVTLSNITVKHIAAVGCGASFDVAQVGLGIGCGACYVTDSTFANSFFDGFENSWGVTNLANSTIELNWSQNQWSSPAHHGETVAVNNCHNSDFPGCTTACPQGLCNYNNTFRYNTIKNCRGTACMAALGPGNVKSMNNWKIYGNVFVDDQSGNGTIATGGMAAFVITDTVIYNNTFISGGTPFRECGAATPCASSSGNVFKNNLLHNNSSLLSTGTGGGTIDTGYNTYWNSIDGVTSETLGQIVTGGACPMLNCAIDAIGDYHLANGTSVNAGLTLAAPYNTDMYGITRGADGKWDRGAFEFSSTQLPPPQNLRFGP